MDRFYAKTRAEYEAIMDYFEEQGYLWNAGQKPREYVSGESDIIFTVDGRGRFGASVLSKFTKDYIKVKEFLPNKVAGYRKRGF